MTLLYSLSHESCITPQPSPNILALDFETCAFVVPTKDFKGRTRHEPFLYPHPVVLSTSEGEVWSGDDMWSLLEAVFNNPSKHTVWHNISFDVGVIRTHAPRSCCDALFRAVSENRAHDSMLLEHLIELAHGRRHMAASPRIVSRSLAELAERRCGMKLEKVEAIRTGFGAFLGKENTIPQEYLHYAARDAIATLYVYLSQCSEARRLCDRVVTTSSWYADHIERLGLLGESLQVRGALALSWLQEFPLHVDLEQCSTLRDRFSTEMRLLESGLTTFGWATTDKHGVFHLKTKFIRDILKQYGRANNLTFPVSPTGLICLNYDELAPLFGEIPDAIAEDPTKAATTPERMSVWLRHQRLHKMIATYLDTYATAPQHYTTYYPLGAATGRTSSVRPNVQNISKRKDGIRALFIAPPGMELVESDYVAAELVSLAQVYHYLYGGSTLAARLASGDPHTALARQLTPDFDSRPESEREKLRQAAKAVGFGLPGGLGAATFSIYAKKSYGLDLTLEQARALRREVLDADPELKAYLTDDGSDPLASACRNLRLSLDDLATAFQCLKRDGTVRHDLLRNRLRRWSRGEDRFTIDLPYKGFDRNRDTFREAFVAIPGGLVRGNVGYTEVRNSRFQGTTASGLKEGLWRIFLAWHADPALFQPVAQVHDSFLFASSPTRIADATACIEGSMIEGMAQVAPNIPARVETEVKGQRWGGNTNRKGEAI